MKLLEDLPNLPTMVTVAVAGLWVGGYQQWAVLVLVLGLIGYAVEVAFFPWVECPPRQWSPFTQSFKTCGKCGGLGKRIRLGRRIWTSATDVNEDRK